MTIAIDLRIPNASCWQRDRWMLQCGVRPGFKDWEKRPDVNLSSLVYTSFINMQGPDIPQDGRYPRKIESSLSKSPGLLWGQPPPAILMLPWNLLHYSVFLRRKHSLLRRARMCMRLRITCWIVFSLLTYLWQPGPFIITQHAPFVLHLGICFLSVCGSACGRENHGADTLVSPVAALLPALGSFSRRSQHSSAPGRGPEPSPESTGSSWSVGLMLRVFISSSIYHRILPIAFPDTEWGNWGPFLSHVPLLTMLVFIEVTPSNLFACFKLKGLFLKNFLEGSLNKCSKFLKI